MTAAASSETFPLNVGLMRVTAFLGNNQPAPAANVMIDIFSDERDQSGQRSRQATGIKPGTLLRLGAGVYQIVSHYGDGNAIVQADFTVEPGKLTEATMVHHAARVSFKLVTRSGGEAMADTQWTISNRAGETVKESAGALPQHTLAPGAYTVAARSQGKIWRRTFSVRSGDNIQVEVLMQ